MSIREGRVALSVGHPRGTHSRYVIGCYLIPLGICGLKNNSRRITYGIGCVWGMPSLSPLSSLAESEYQDLKRQGHCRKDTSHFLYSNETVSICFVCLLFPSPLSKIPFKRNLNLKIVKFKQAFALRNDFCDVTLS